MGGPNKRCPLALACLLALGGEEPSLSSLPPSRPITRQPPIWLSLFTSLIAMSWNPATNGEYTFQDAYQERLLPTKQQKSAQAKRLIQKRISRLGITGVAKHLALAYLLALPCVVVENGMVLKITKTNKTPRQKSKYLFLSGCFFHDSSFSQPCLKGKQRLFSTKFWIISGHDSV